MEVRVLYFTRIGKVMRLVDFGRLCIHLEQLLQRDIPKTPQVNQNGMLKNVQVTQRKTKRKKKKGKQKENQKEQTENKQ